MKKAYTLKFWPLFTVDWPSRYPVHGWNWLPRICWPKYNGFIWGAVRVYLFGWTFAVHWEYRKEYQYQRKKI